MGFVRICGVLAAFGCLLPAQSKRPEDLAPGKILVTVRDAPDPLFAKSVIVLVRYDADGALGLMINRRSDVPISEALHELSGASAHADPVYVGGPVELNTVFALARSAKKPAGTSAIFGNVYLLTERSALEKALGGKSDAKELRIYLGYCGWGRQQLENEVRLGAWYIFNPSVDAAFDDQPATLWARMIEKAESLKAREFWPRINADEREFTP